MYLDAGRVASGWGPEAFPTEPRAAGDLFPDWPAAALLAERTSGDENGYEARLTATVLVALLTETLLFWTEHDGEPDLTALFTRALDHLGGLSL
ncbi:hypothetical protein ACF1BS_21225 [Streptomyces sp. NPDC014748]|uniref:acyl-CoA-like ligand-binding transcription factor n=1 Tax=Streptomyces sp. NPDC014748 TaxID=3364905 RepID=UPI0037034020